ncbi:hypothetical protein [Luteithermobacter gelatinilyticus]|uniref:hypothetical protein n=1 Tax=Luteithermobacter gelatinilyticus TaxID=2582913 RepID=UPI0011071466|nr:hypothetical protein [Luteithermobacter gelatinilyticus]
MMTETVDHTDVPGHSGPMMGRKKELPRKPLRQRVADRKAGREQKAAPPSKQKQKYMRWAKWTANALQAVGILIMLVVVMRFMDNNIEYIEELVAIAAGIFLLGRFGLVFLRSL